MTGIENNGITLGRNAYSDDDKGSAQAHEFFHMKDINLMGWINFYSKWTIELLKNIGHDIYTVAGTLEYNARQYQINWLRRHYGY